MLYEVITMIENFVGIGHIKIAGQRQVARPPIVITSYSIHYTKLYDPLVQALLAVKQHHVMLFFRGDDQRADRLP